MKDKIFELIENLTGIKNSAIVSSSCKRELVWLRFMICYILRDKTKLSLSQIGLIINRDHASVVNADRCFENELNTKRPVQITADLNIVQIYKFIKNELDIQ